MKTVRNLSTTLLLAGLVITTFPAGAVSFNSIRSISRQNTGGSSFVNMTPSANTFCYLSSVGFRDTDSSTELAQCRLTRGAVVWTLEAVLSQNDDADAFCSAICYNN